MNSLAQYLSVVQSKDAMSLSLVLAFVAFMAASVYVTVRLCKARELGPAVVFALASLTAAVGLVFLLLSIRFELSQRVHYRQVQHKRELCSIRADWARSAVMVRLETSTRENIERINRLEAACIAKAEGRAND